eukprot:TRINITY_DN14375_c0_g1_i1.p1 TRINITY_DN14375_c0_g1~~TRINITY_DN14375_c0_g1_i1.p1  ORF type:complete len:340 (+),score=68.33 TRINITY_DN14375_c0_g1_i1:188-1207(+)
MWWSQNPPPRKQTKSWALSPASSARYWLTSGSLMPGGKSQERARSGSGITSNSSSTEPRPRAASMDWRSSGVWGVQRMALFSLGQKLVVGGCIHKVVQLGLIESAQLDQPSRAIAILVDQLGLVFQGAVHLGHHPAQGSIDVRRGLDRLHHAHLAHLFHLCLGLGQFHVGDVAQLVLGIVGEAHHGQIALQRYPLVLLGVVETLGHLFHFAHLSPPSNCMGCRYRPWGLVKLLTTLPGRVRLRQLISTSCPIWAPPFSRARPRGRLQCSWPGSLSANCQAGIMVPLVSSPRGFPPASTSEPSRIMPLARPATANTRWGRFSGPPKAWASRAARPRKSPR